MRLASLRHPSIVPSLVALVLLAAGTARATSFPEFVDPNPSPENFFGQFIVPLATGNVVVTAPFDDAGGMDAGAVYLFDGSTGALISTLTGSSANDQVGSGGAIALTNGNFVVRSPFWDNGGTTDAGAVTWGDGTTGISGSVSAANSLVGTTTGDQVGISGVDALPNGKYVVRSSQWNNGGIAGAGAATLADGTTGLTGAVSVANSLVGSSTADMVGTGITVLTNGNYVLANPFWDGGFFNAGAATWVDGNTGLTGTISAANSLVGTQDFEFIGGDVVALTNGNYVVVSTNWGGFTAFGAITWGDGTSGIAGNVSAANSLVGTTVDDNVGSGGIFVLTNGNYVVVSPNWDNGGIANAGAVTWGDGTSGSSGQVSAGNSLVGSTADDGVGSSGVVALTNGHYVVSSAFWDNGGIANAGAATWGDGTSGTAGAVSAANSLVGSTANDRVGNNVVALANGNYVVASPMWDDGGTFDAGAATWGDGTSGVAGAVSASNSLVGSTIGDAVGSITALTNGNYVVSSPFWDGGVFNGGAATWCNGTVGLTGTITPGNSLVGSQVEDQVGLSVTALANGNYVVGSPFWANGWIDDAGAATWGDGASGTTGSISAANSLVGSTTSNRVASGGIDALANGNYVVRSSVWDRGGMVDAGAVTWGDGSVGLIGVVSAANSLVGSSPGDGVGSQLTALSDGNFVTATRNWDDTPLFVTDPGAVTWGDGAIGDAGPVTAGNSLIGPSASVSQITIVEDVVNAQFYARMDYLNERRILAGPPDYRPSIASLTDVPDDQGGWLRLTFDRSSLDVATGSAPIETYGIWRYVPGTVPAVPGGPVDGTSRMARLAGPLDLDDTHGSFIAEGLLSRWMGVTSVFPPGSWELVQSVPALQQLQYVVVVPTISNAAANEFVVTAHTNTPSVWLISESASGQSVDNLAPAPPAPFTAKYEAGATELHWGASGEADFATYNLHRGATIDFVPGPGNLIYSAPDTGYSDAGPAGSYYKLSAEDVNGNESDFALITPDGTVDVPNTGPVAFALEPLRNPSHGGRLRVSFSLPRDMRATLEIIDVSGRRVASRDVGTLGAGRHELEMGDGRRISSGVYFVRLMQGKDVATRRVTMLE